VGDACRFRHPVALADRDPDALEVLQDVVGNRRGAGKTDLDPVEPQPLLELPEDGKVGDPIGEA